MLFPQYLLIGVVALVAVGAFLEASAYAGYRVTPKRLVLAALLPGFWIALVALWPWLWLWSIALAALPSPMPQWLHVLGWIVGGTLVAALVTGIGPALWVFSIVGWVGAALTGTLTGDLRSWLRARLPRQKP